jgi:MYXO-CTERM domain-containing protein
MPAAAQILMLAALVVGDPEFALHLRAPVVEPTATPSVRPPQAPAPDQLPVPYDDAVPMPPVVHSATDIQRPDPARPRRKLGTNTTIFVNFDGVEIGDCTPSNSHENCHWLETGTTFAPYSGSLPHRVAILDAMRSQINDFGVRVTGQRPPESESYVMVVYGGESVDEEALGRAPAGGFDHVGLPHALMSPSGGNTIAKFFDGCAQIVQDPALTPVEDEGSCPQISLEQCGLPDFQHDVAMLHLLFGDPYVDAVAPSLELVTPFDGAYFVGPADFGVELRIIDDQHPQRYELSIGIRDLIDDPAFSPVYDPSFDVEALPVGEWVFELRLRDAAGNETSLDFVILVGDEPLPLDDGCNCASATAPGSGSRALWLLGMLGMLGIGLIRLRRRK